MTEHNETATSEEIKDWDEENDEPHPVFAVPHRPERQKAILPDDKDHETA